MVRWILPSLGLATSAALVLLSLAALFGWGWALPLVGVALGLTAVFGLGSAAWWVRGRLSLRRIFTPRTGPEDEVLARRLDRMVRRVAERAGVAVPEVEVIEGEQANAFAVVVGDTGRICVTRGFVDNLSREQGEALLALQLSRIETGLAARTTRMAWAGNAIAQVASFGRAGRSDVDANPFAVPTATMAAPLAAFLAELGVDAGAERRAEQMAMAIIEDPDDLVRGLERAEFTAHVQPLPMPAAFATTGVVSPHLGAPSTSLARLYPRGTPVAHRFPGGLEGRRSRATDRRLRAA